MMMDDELQCGICLDLFQDPRSLPCLHTFCVECIQRTLNDKHSLKCPVCRAEHHLGEEGAKLLPVNAYARQELTRKRLRQELEKDAKSANLVVKPSLLMWHGVVNAVSSVNPALPYTRRWHV